MCTLTHFGLQTRHSSPLLPAMLRHTDARLAEPSMPRFQVVLAGNAFFHIKETSTGHVRGFRSNHNDACALARALDMQP